jgi:hypothetical protein
VQASSGTEGASFLEIPVGAAPAATGSSYSARATDAYAPVWNPAGLGFVNAVHFSGTQLSYLESISYQYAGLVVPLGGSDDQEGFSLHHSRGLGVSAQYLGSGNITAANDQGLITGSFSANFAAYSLAYGQKLTDRWSVGLTGKVIQETIADTTARAYGGDAGTMFKVSDQLSLAGVVTNLGSSVKFVNESDPLPLAYRLGAVVQIFPTLDVSAEAVDRKSGHFSVGGGVQWTCEKYVVLRAGLDSSHTSGLSGSSVLTAGVGIHVWGQEFAYAWVPYGDLGSANYFSLDLRFGGPKETSKPGLIKVEEKEPEFSIESLSPQPEQGVSDYQQIQNILTESEKRALQNQRAPSAPDKQP